MMNKPIFILGAHKSGSTLLRSLLDGHHELFVVPLETHIFQNACFWVDYRLRRTHPQALGFEAIKQNFINQVEEYNTSTDYMSDANLVGRFDMRRFRKQFLATSAKTFDEIISQYLAAIYENLFHKSMPEHLRIVEKSVENAEFAIDLNHMYADAKFIHILRNPYANVVSLRRHIGRKGYPFLAQIILALKNSFYNLYRNRRLIDNYLIIKYEDLITNLPETMKIIAGYLDIDYCQTLLEPTILGKAWKGNSSRNITYSGVSSSNLQIWYREINHLEIYFITKYFHFILNEFGYEVMKRQKSMLMPVQRENPAIYLLNRLIGIYL